MPECLLSIWKPWVKPPVSAAKLGLVLKSWYSQLSGDRGSRMERPRSSSGCGQSAVLGTLSEREGEGKGGGRERIASWAIQIKSQ